jgi:ribulose-phosphate 3-epimerase
MDGHFVPNLSMGPDIVAMARRTVKIPLSVHLMVTRPDFFAEPFLKAGADLLLFQIEARCEPAPGLEFIRNFGRRAGIVLNPETPIEAIDGVLDRVDEVLFMTVHPGFGGQAFIPTVLPKIANLRARRPDLDISVDGGITVETAKACAKAGVNVFIAGTSLYRAADMAAETARMRREIQAAP